MLRQPSRTESSSSSEITFDDVDDQQVFAFLDDGDDGRRGVSASGTGSKGVEFRLDLSSRINPAPMATSSARAVVRSPKMRAQSVAAKKARTRRPPESPVRSWLAVVPAAMASPAAAVDAVMRDALADAEEATKEAEARAKTHAEALAALQLELQQGELERERLRGELHAARATVQDLEHKVAAAEQSSDLFARQLANVKESYQTKLLLRDEAVAIEKAAVTKEKESELQHQQALFAQETELWKQQIAALAKSQQAEQQEHSERVKRLLREHEAECAELLARCRALEAAQSHDRDEIRCLTGWKEQCEHALAACDARQVETEQERGAWAVQCEQLAHDASVLTMQVNGLLMEREDRSASIQLARQQFERQHAEAQATVRCTVRSADAVRSDLRRLASSTRELVRSEVQTMREMLRAVQEQAFELAVRQQQRETQAAAKQSRIIQLEAQLKNDKQAVNQLEAALSKATRALEKKGGLFKSKYSEQKEHLELTLAVRQGLVHELQAKKQQALELEAKLAQAALAKRKAEAKNSQLQQQVQILQHTHARELEKFALAAASEVKKMKTRKPSIVAGATPGNNGASLWSWSSPTKKSDSSGPNSEARA
ncbi:hypothetical protein PybrP1_003114 [[Pythium] brassicae (nom. inval.)]|nr:hypothetical protein PybrP1_003114 [[Pythium] brassicae (nom. inval.)]